MNNFYRSRFPDGMLRLWRYKRTGGEQRHRLSRLFARMHLALDQIQKGGKAALAPSSSPAAMTSSARRLVDCTSVDPEDRKGAGKAGAFRKMRRFMDPLILRLERGFPFFPSWRHVLNGRGGRRGHEGLALAIDIIIWPADKRLLSCPRLRAWVLVAGMAGITFSPGGARIGAGRSLSS